MSEICRAYFIRLADEAARGLLGSGRLPSKAIPVQFNPASLQHTVSINEQQIGARPDNGQFVGSAGASLQMDLEFDTTASGQDVRSLTLPIRYLAASADSAEMAGDTDEVLRSPPKVAFVWGTFRFVGTISAFTETLNFFSADGVPVRSKAQLQMRCNDSAEVYAGSLAEANAMGLGLALDFGLRDGLGASIGLGGSGAGTSGLGFGARGSPGFADAAAGRVAAAAQGKEATRQKQASGGALQPYSVTRPKSVSGKSAVADDAKVANATAFGFGGKASAGSAGARAALSGSLRFSHSGGS